jgi:RNA polymerase sigma factor (sigma-70 family)
MELTDLELKLEELNPRLKAIAHKISFSSPEHDADDIYQEMIMTLITVSKQSPDFLSQKPSFIITKLTWCAKNKANASRIWTRYCPPDQLVTDPDGDETSFFEMVAGPSPTPEKEVIMQELRDALQDLMETLTPRQRQVMTMLSQGYKPSEIAAEIGVTKSAITWICRKVLSPQVRRAII